MSRSSEDTRLLVLGTLQDGDLHAYELVQQLKRLHTHNYIDVGYSKVYYCFEQLLKDGFIAVAGRVQDTKRPERTVYRINSSGRDEFRRLLLERFHDTSRYFFHPLYPALLYIDRADPDLLAPALRERIQALEDEIEQLESIAARHGPALRPGMRRILSNSIGLNRAELAWSRQLLDDVACGRLVVSETQPQNAGDIP